MAKPKGLVLVHHTTCSTQAPSYGSLPSNTWLKSNNYLAHAGAAIVNIGISLNLMGGDLMLMQCLSHKLLSDSTVKTSTILCCAYSSDMGSKVSKAAQISKLDTTNITAS